MGQISAWVFRGRVGCIPLGEFAVTAGWNREKLSIDCMFETPVLDRHSSDIDFVLFSAYLLTNGMEYHLANSVAVLEFLITVYFFPNFKRETGITVIGKHRATSSLFLLANDG